MENPMENPQPKLEFSGKIIYLMMDYQAMLGLPGWSRYIKIHYDRSKYNVSIIVYLDVSRYSVIMNMYIKIEYSDQILLNIHMYQDSMCFPHTKIHVNAQKTDPSNFP